MNDHPTHNPTGPTRPATLRGPWIVAATLSLFVVVPAGTYVALRAVQHDLHNNEHDQPLDWTGRTHWPAFEVRYKSLERGMMSRARTNQTYKDYGFAVTPELEASIERCRELARGMHHDFPSPQVRDALAAEADAHPENFYASALLATWHRIHGNTDDAGAAWTRAFAAAPAAMVQHITDADGNPLPHADVGTVGFAFDRVVADHLDPSMTLVYPAVTTGDDGIWRLPIFKAILRLTDPALGPAGPNDPHAQASITFVGRVGRLPNAAMP